MSTGNKVRLANWLTDFLFSEQVSGYKVALHYLFLFFNRCGQETRVIPRILQMRQHWVKSKKESVRLEEAGVHSDVSMPQNVQRNSW